MVQARSDAKSHRQSGLRAGSVILAVAFIAVVAWATHRPAHRPQARALFEAPAAAAATAPAKAASEPGKAPSQAQPAGPAPAQASAAKPADAKKQVPRVDLVISHLADERGSLEPCG